MLSIKELKELARRMKPSVFTNQIGPFALVQRPEEAELPGTQVMGQSPIGIETTQMAAPDAVSQGILSLLFEVDRLEVVTLPPMAAGDVVLSVGRLPDCDLVLDHGSVSKRHAEIWWDEGAGAGAMKDLGSTNGTFLNSALLFGREAWLRDGDILSFGEVQFWYLLAQTLYDRLRRVG